MDKPRSVVITGASRGLGLASAAYLYKQGWRVIGAMRSLDTGLESLRAAAGAAAGDSRLIGIRLDVTDPKSVAAAAQGIENAVGAPDVLVHNAGVAATGAVEEMPIDVFEQLFATNFFGPVMLTQALLPAMRACGRGRIVIVSSTAGIRGMPSISAYSASKAALERWVEALAEEIAPFGVGVTVLVAGAFKTDIITDKTADYGNHAGPYRAHYLGMRRMGGAMTDKANPPEVFARALAKAIAEQVPFARHTVGADAAMLAFSARLLSGRRLHELIRKSLGLPKFAALRTNERGEIAAGSTLSGESGQHD